MMPNLEGIMTLMAHILCNIHIWPPIVWEPTNPQNCLFSIVCSVIFSPPSFLFSQPFFSTSSEESCTENRRLFHGEGHCWATTLRRKQLCIPLPRKYFSLKTMACFDECVTSQRGCKLRPGTHTVTHVGLRSAAFFENTVSGLFCTKHKGDASYWC